jgi:patatin-like phospholipase/acyl hydrolase
VSEPAQEIHTPFRVLSLDGGGAKGFYSLGVLMEVEAMVGKPLWQASI